MKRVSSIVLALVLPVIAAGQALSSAQGYVTSGIFIASIEEGGRIFTPVRLLPFGHAEALNHEFPTVQQFHGGEDQIVIVMGQAIGLRLGATLQRYPTQPDAAWPYPEFKTPPVAAIEHASVIFKRTNEAPLPGLRAVAYVDRFPVSFIVDTRGLTLEQRHMRQATTMGLDITRAAFLDALQKAGQFVPREGAVILAFDDKQKSK